MKRMPFFTAKTVNISINHFAPEAVPGQLAIDRSGFYAQSGKSGVFNAAPELGAVWPGQGGFNGGLIAARGDVPEHYLIIAAKDVGDHEWGGRGIEVKGLSKTDGCTNAQVLIGSEDSTEYPAANACAEHQADGHHDFYLPAAAELYHCWLSVPDLFAKDTWYWSSTQRSANDAFGMTFDDGDQGTSCKYSELRVRPVRRLFI